MTARELADLLDGNKSEISEIFSIVEKLEAKKAGLAVMFESRVNDNDLTVIRGAIDHNLGRNVSGPVYFDTDGLLKNCCPDQRCPYFKEQKLKAKKITVIRNADGYLWSCISPDIYHETFDILQEELQMKIRGIVFPMKALEKR